MRERYPVIVSECRWGKVGFADECFTANDCRRNGAHQIDDNSGRCQYEVPACLGCDVCAAVWLSHLGGWCRGALALARSLAAQHSICAGPPSSRQRFATSGMPTILLVESLPLTIPSPRTQCHRGPTSSNTRSPFELLTGHTRCCSHSPMHMPSQRLARPASARATYSYRLEVLPR
jgi:hypothetical protein